LLILDALQEILRGEVGICGFKVCKLDWGYAFGIMGQ